MAAAMAHAYNVIPIDGISAHERMMGRPPRMGVDIRWEEITGLMKRLPEHEPRYARLKDDLVHAATQMEEAVSKAPSQSFQGGDIVLKWMGDAFRSKPAKMGARHT